MSSIMTRVQEIINELTRRKRSIPCGGSSGVLILLEELGFTHTAGKTDGHRVFVNKELSELSDFTTHSVDCGHKPNRDMNFRYIVKTITKLKLHQNELEAIYYEKHA